VNARLVDCNLVMKGGVTSGLVYAGAFPGLAARYRFRAVAGSSAGAIAASFLAAAEFARAQGDPDGFARLEACCRDLPRQLLGLFQPSPPFRRLMRALVLLAPGTGQARWASALGVFWPVLATGGVAGGLLGAWLGGGFAAALAAAVGAVGALAAHLAWLIGREGGRHAFGVCTGLSQGRGPGLTDWLHASLQTIAFGDAQSARPLTFGDLAACEPPIDLKIVVTDLSHAALQVVPDLGLATGFRHAAWSRLFPAAVLAHLGAASAEGIVPLGAPANLPVLAAVRMSLSCPALMEAVPLVDAEGRDIWISDGGLTANFPFEIFERDPQDRPTLALDFDTLDRRDVDAPRVRRLDPGAAQDRPAPLGGLRGFAWSLIVALREGRLRSVGRSAGRRVCIYQVRLTADEGGMNLAMTPEQAQRLIDYGRALAEHIVASETEGAT
jgi:predicted acylesterase/phospholipase RssA